MQRWISCGSHFSAEEMRGRMHLTVERLAKQNRNCIWYLGCVNESKEINNLVYRTDTMHSFQMVTSR